MNQIPITDKTVQNWAWNHMNEHTQSMITTSDQYKRSLLIQNYTCVFASDIPATVSHNHLVFESPIHLTYFLMHYSQ